jgi:hypothetical protein
LELRLRRAGTGNSEPVTGTIRGTAIDAGLGPALPKPVQVSLAGSANGAATVDGSMPQTTFALGRIQGSIRFANTSGAFSDCPMVDWTLNEGVR